MSDEWYYSKTKIEDLPGIKEYIERADTERLFGLANHSNKLVNWKIKKNYGGGFFTPIFRDSKEDTVLAYLDAFEYERDDQTGFPCGTFGTSPTLNNEADVYLYIDHWHSNYTKSIAYLTPSYTFNCISIELPLHNMDRAFYKVRNELEDIRRGVGRNTQNELFILVDQDYRLDSKEFTEQLLEFSLMKFNHPFLLSFDMSTVRWVFYKRNEEDETKEGAESASKALMQLLLDPCIIADINRTTLSIYAANGIVKSGFDPHLYNGLVWNDTWIHARLDTPSGRDFFLNLVKDGIESYLDT